MQTKSRTTAAIAGVVMAATVCCLLLRRLQRPQKTTALSQYLNSEAQEIHNHIQETQTPARLLGIRVDNLTQDSLTLSAPLSLNTNVHGTAFAGSLYAVGVLCSYYLARSWLWKNNELHGYTLVAKAGGIDYRRPVTRRRIVATSFLPPVQILERFCQELATKHKASMNICGQILLADNTVNKNVACDYTIEVCAYRARG